MHAKTDDLENLSDYEHGHIPYLLLLLHYLERWKVSHDGNPPENYKEKSAFRNLIHKGIRTNNVEGGEENYDEAVGAVLKSIHPISIASGLRAIFEDEECQNLKHSVSYPNLTAHYTAVTNPKSLPTFTSWPTPSITSTKPTPSSLSPAPSPT